jgi:hypothetical protein
MTEKQPESDLSEEFRRLGQNLKQAAEAAWTGPEGQRLRGEIKAGLQALEKGINDTAVEMTTGETGQKIKTEVNEFSERVRSGQVEKQLRQDLLSALRSLNSHFDQAAGKSSGEPL